MRPPAGLSVLLLSVLGLATGCDTDQPLEFEQRNASLQFTAPSSRVTKYRVHTVFEDSTNPTCAAGTPPGDGTADYGLFTWCDRQLPLFSLASSVPWPFAVEIKILPDGETEAQTVALSTIVGDTKAIYDPSRLEGSADVFPGNADIVVHTRGFCSGNPLRTCDPLNFASTFCSQLSEGTCRPALGFCTGNSSLPCEPGVSPGPCQQLSAGTCQADPRGFCSGNRCLRCDSNNPGTTCSAAGAGTCTLDGACSGLPSTPCNIIRRFGWRTQHVELTSASREYSLNYAGDYALLFDVSQAKAVQRDPEAGNGGRCPGFDGGPALISGLPQPLTFQLQKGDTLFVEARRLLTTPPGIEFDPTASQPSLAAQLTIDGQNANVIGDTLQQTASTDDFIDFHITVP